MASNITTEKKSKDINAKNAVIYGEKKMNQKNKEEKTTLTDLLKQDITVKVYQLILILATGYFLGILFK